MRGERSIAERICQLMWARFQTMARSAFLSYQSLHAVLEHHVLNDECVAHLVLCAGEELEIEGVRLDLVAACPRRVERPEQPAELAGYGSTADAFRITENAMRDRFDHWLTASTANAKSHRSLTMKRTPSS